MTTGRAETVLVKRAVLVTGLILSAALTACASAPPKSPVASVQAPPPGADPIPLAVQRHGRSDGEYGRKADEAGRLAGLKDVWRRGDILTVDTDEGIQFRFVDAGVCEGFYTCRRWIFRGSVQVPPLVKSENSAPSDYRLIEFDQGEGGHWLAINVAAATSTVLDTEPKIAPDKRRWATGECNAESSDSLTILEADAFGRMIPAAVTAEDAPCCDVLGWDGAALKVKTCEIEPDKPYTDRLVRQADGRWVGKRIRLEKPKGP